MEENQHQLYIACKSSKGNIMVLWNQISEFFFETVQGNEFIYFYRRDLKD